MRCVALLIEAVLDRWCASGAVEGMCEDEVELLG